MTRRNLKSGPSDVTALFKRDGSPVDFSRLAENLLAVPGPQGTSYPESRHLVGICPENAVPDAYAVDWTAEENAAAQAAIAAASWTFNYAQPLGGHWTPKSAYRLDAEALEYETAYRLRELLALHDSALECDCGGEGKVLQHAHSDRQRLTPYRCQKRATCPACGRAYGRTRGLELVNLARGLFEPGRLLPVVDSAAADQSVKFWHIVLSCDPRVSAYVERLALAGEVEQVRRVLRHLTEDVDSTLADVYGSGVAAIVCWHWWNSGNPVSQRVHLHAHVSVPNIRVDNVDGVWTPAMRELRRKGVLPSEQLDKLKYGFGRRVAAHRWAKPLVLPPVPGGRDPRRWQVNAHVKFSLSELGAGGYSHRLRYDGRAPVEDMIRLVEPVELWQARNLHRDALELADVDELRDMVVVDVAELACNYEGVSWWCHMAQFWQKIQTVRYTGWLVNSARKSLGLLRENVEQTDPEWSSVGLYRVLSLDGHALRVERWNSGGRYEQSWHLDHVDLLPPPAAPRGYAWSDDVRPVRQAGPPVSWLARSGLTPVSALHVPLAAAGD